MARGADARWWPNGLEFPEADVDVVAEAAAAARAGTPKDTLLMNSASVIFRKPARVSLGAWATDGGATLDGVRESNGALVATKDVKKNGVLATLPSDLALALCDPDEDE